MALDSATASIITMSDRETAAAAGCETPAAPITAPVARPRTDLRSTSVLLSSSSRAVIGFPLCRIINPTKVRCAAPLWRNCGSAERVIRGSRHVRRQQEYRDHSRRLRKINTLRGPRYHLATKKNAPPRDGSGTVVRG